MERELIVDVYWDGPFKWEKRQNELKENHVIYTMYGQHLVYGPYSLLYIGRTSDIATRLYDHNKWVAYEYDKVELRCASIGYFQGWEEWENQEDYAKADTDLVADVESLLIFAHQPAYNTKGKVMTRAKELRIFNTGHLGPLLPEVSSLYMSRFGD
jgi:hypothetical protein